MSCPFWSFLSSAASAVAVTDFLEAGPSRGDFDIVMSLVFPNAPCVESRRCPPSPFPPVRPPADSPSQPLSHNHSTTTTKMAKGAKKTTTKKVAKKGGAKKGGAKKAKKAGAKKAGKKAAKH
jgi:hypothetical protein